MQSRRFMQVDVFTPTPTQGNGLAVVLDGDGLSDQQMQDFATWTNLAETTFIQSATSPDADYRLRIFSLSGEMLFAGHPTLGSCAAWLAAGGVSKRTGVVVQECGVGLVEIDQSGPMPAFAAPATTVDALDPDQVERICAALALPRDRITRTARLNNGPTWQVIELQNADDVLAVAPFATRGPEFRGVALLGAGGEADVEVRNLGPASSMSEDPITGSLNAALACWKYETGDWTGPKVIAQGTCIGRTGRVYADCREGTVWIGGQSHILIDGTVTL
ncbi:PhzF family phenazine biosynthesis protein [Tropicibacter sp. R16_0]|uniref:PhzF family phenazine biosynthesis protein n=1 Tax=Tropicibacter sp. R16_0 TaxID=2821102 RepID=UPI001ADA501E|nr:PhzF family phenazine biosynthesis protein [Tropicibacter sp. R16_0]MBO9450803.1 PhzF family phenazine biosynthesis protein [Tropicibacter sp. R16_0]